jgi:hypothetical protein
MDWSLIYPEYKGVIPDDRIIRRPLAFALSPASEDLARIVDQWVVLERARGDSDAAYNYWVLGRGSEPQTKRWSIAHNVLGWLD